MAVVTFENVDVVFGDSPELALGLLDQGGTREDILETTGNVIGVAGASLEIEEGEICVLMGLSGSGKSTLLRCVNGLNPVTRGRVLVQDGAATVDVASCAAPVLRGLRRGRIAMVFQQFALLPWRTVRENVGLGLELRGLPKPERDDIVSDKLRLVGLDQWQDKYAHELSGGMQQRVGLARAFATDADILLMDEPFSALDPLIRSHLQDELLELQESLKKTIIFVSHDLDEALKIGTHIAIMDGGRIVQYGEPEEIVLAPANQYVAEFVAHMNPLEVLKGKSLMTLTGAVPRDGEDLLMEWTGSVRLRLDTSGWPASVSISGVPGKLVDYRTSQPPLDEDCDTVAMVSPDVILREALEIRHQTGRPLAIVSENRLVGVIGDEEIYQAMLRQTKGTA